MDFVTLPPEVTSALIHSGPGPGSLIEASGAWQRLGSGLEESVPTYASVVSSLIEAWQGPSSVAMTQAVAPYLAWLRTTAQQCQQIASSTLAAVAAFTSVRASVVSVAQVSANRTRLAQLLATNTFGINLPAIAATEDQYQAMWANNSAAMSRYRAASAQATTLPQFFSPPQIASPTATAQASAVSAAAAASTPAAPTLGNIFNIFAPGSNTGGTGLAGLLNVFSGSAGSSFGSLLNSNLVTGALVNTIFGSGLPINLLSYLAQNTAAQALQAVGGDIGTGLSEGQAALGAGAGAFGAAGLSAEPTAAIGVGVSVGELTAPAAVVGLLPASHTPVQLASAVAPLPSEESGLPLPFLPPLMPPPISAGSGWRKRKQQTYGESEDPEYEKYDEYEDGSEEALPESPGSGWRKRGKDYDEIEYGAELPGTVMQKPPSAG
jgi:PPE-repeat protein